MDVSTTVVHPTYEGGSNIGYLFRDIYRTAPFTGAGIVDGKWIWTDPDQVGMGNIRDGLYPVYGRGYNTAAGNVLNFDFTLEQKLDFITKGLKVHAKASYNSSITLIQIAYWSYPHYEPIVNPDGTGKYY